MKEKRKSKRMEISVCIKLKPIEPHGELRDYYVEVLNVSKGGMAFKSEYELNVDDYYDTQITIWTKERIDTVIRIVRHDGDIYGSEFVGLAAADEMKINIYEMFNYPDEEE